MSAVWITVLFAGVASMALKSFGPVILGGRAMSALFRSSVALLAPGLLAALVVTQTFAEGRALTLDARILGVVAAAGAPYLRAPILVVIGVAALVTAAARAL